MTQVVTTFCRLCEAKCGLLATVEGGEITHIASDPDHVGSLGHFCIKAIAVIDITYDRDRVINPLRRTDAPGEFEECSWDDAINDIAARLTRIHGEYGGESIASVIGNPAAMNFSFSTFFPIFQKAIGIKNRYSINSEDGASKMVANMLLYGSPMFWLKPDFWRTDFAIIIGANPLVSKGSGLSEPRLRDALDAIVARGGRVVVIDPRRTETAKRYEHVFVRPGTDAWLLIGMLLVLIEQERIDDAFVSSYVSGFDEFTAALDMFDLATCSKKSTVPIDVIRQLALGLADARSGLIYGRTGTCTQQFGTLVNALQDMIVAVTGNLDREGGSLIGWSPIDVLGMTAAAGEDTYASFHSRVDGFPECFGSLPSHALLADISEPGPGRVRAVINIASNTVLSGGAGSGSRLAAALDLLDLHVSLDIYMNETNKHAHYILPTTTMYEREDFPLLIQGNILRPGLWATKAVVTPRGEARPEWRIIRDLAAAMGLGDIFAPGGHPLTPQAILDGMLADSECPDLTFDRLVQEFPHGVALRDKLPTGVFLPRLRTADSRMAFAHPEFLEELRRLKAHSEPTELPLRLIGMRELQSLNSWMHNSPRLMTARRTFGARINPADASALGIADGDVCVITSQENQIEVRAMLTEDVRPGTIALPHGWGHEGGWRYANAAGGENSNRLTSSLPENIERLAAMSVLNGIPVRLSR